MVYHSECPNPQLPASRSRRIGIGFRFGIGLRIASIALAASLAISLGSQAQTVEVPTAKAAAKRVKAAPAGDTQQAAAAPTKRDPAAAQAAIETGGKLLESGKTDQAVATLSSAISGGNLPPGVMAKALYLRGSAYRKQNKPALAISDLTSALWLKGGLSDADRADATQQRTAAYSEAGLGEQGQASSSAATGAASRKRTDGAVATLAPDNGSSGGGTVGLFPNLFGGSSTPAVATPPAEASSPKPARAVPRTPPSTDGLAQPSPAAPPATAAAARIAAVSAAPAIKPAAATASASGQFQSRVALVRSKPEADAVIAKLKSQHAAALGDKAASVGETAFGNMGSFFQVRVGPYATAAEAAALCGRLKGSGLDCVAINN